ncbi:hypothetical protein H310_05384 [Aphanomyces invadans]|uniref:Uncharacterized protein n=1 Tax=Aphanomyces invadans TaxID=157072 RepID=A0A024UAP3_9STRA|nr:hypothetical protein H310_05384 [Aphanomyces invadans]ETW02932.1 hypothetical protein H310_05384 [Aphanomyces invadans]RHY31925.1 hypothetical protein DYB32_003030 [Aphanomyces invadans]|eukprot:XP_008868316.1 hypothetical protein H310_05384 [Aphanomyces invadans]
MGATKASQELSPLLKCSPVTSTPNSSPAYGDPAIDVALPVKSTRSVRNQAKPKVEEVYPLPWFRSPDMPKRPIRMVLKKETPKSAIATWAAGVTTSFDGDKCIHVLVAAILLCTIVVILSIIYDSGKKSVANDSLHPHSLLRGNS